MLVGVELCVPLVSGVSGDWGPAVWCFPLTMPASSHSPFSFSTTTKAVGRECVPRTGPNWGFYHSSPSCWYAHYRWGRNNRLSLRWGLHSVRAWTKEAFFSGQHASFLASHYDIFKPTKSRQLGMERKSSQLSMTLKLYPSLRLSQVASIICPNCDKYIARCSLITWGGTSNIFTLGYHLPSYLVWITRSFVISSWLEAFM